VQSVSRKGIIPRNRYILKFLFMIVDVKN